MYKVSLERLDGGLNTKSTLYHGDMTQSPELQNVIFDDLGAVATRNGYSKFNHTLLGSAPVDLIYSFEKDSGSSEMIVACKDLLFRMSANTAITIPSAQSVFTHGENIRALTIQNQAFLANGYNAYKWNGTEFTKWGVSAPSAATVATGAAGALTGAYRWVILGVNSNLSKGNYGSASTEITLASERGSLSEIPVFPTSAGVNNKYVCRNTAGASSVYYLVTQISNAQATFTDNTADSYLITAAPLDNGMPPNFTCMVEHMGMIFGASITSSTPSYLWYSDINEPEIFQSDSFIRAGEGDGLPITGLAILENGILISKSNNYGDGAMYYLSTPTTNSLDWTLIKLNTNNSSQSAAVMARFQNSIAFLNKNGIYDISAYTLTDVRVDPLSFNIEPDVFDFAPAYLKNACAISYKNKLWLSVPYGLTQTTNNRVYQYDYVRGRNAQEREYGAWSAFTNMAINNFTIHNGELYGGSSASDGWIYKLDTGYNDNTAAIDSYFKTMAITGLKQHEIYTKVWRYCYITVATTGDWFMDMTYINPVTTESGSVEQIDVDPVSTEWGTFIWGRDVWGATKETAVIRVDFKNAVSTALQLKFSTNTADQYFKIYKVEVFYNLRGLRR